MAELLFVQNAHDVSVEKGKLTLKKVSPTSIFFTDRPERIAGHMTTKDFVDEWDEGGNSFKADPPNAALSVLGKDEIVDIEVTLMNPRFMGADLIYDIAVLEEDGDPISDQCRQPLLPVYTGEKEKEFVDTVSGSGRNEISQRSNRELRFLYN